MRDVAPDSLRTTHTAKKGLLKSKGYKVLTPNDAVTSNFILNLNSSKKSNYFSDKTNDYFFGKGTNTATTEQIALQGRIYPIIVGEASPLGLQLHHFDEASSHIGAAGVMEIS